MSRSSPVLEARPKLPIGFCLESSKKNLIKNYKKEELAEMLALMTISKNRR